MGVLRRWRCVCLLRDKWILGRILEKVKPRDRQESASEAPKAGFSGGRGTWNWGKWFGPVAPSPFHEWAPLPSLLWMYSFEDSDLSLLVFSILLLFPGLMLSGDSKRFISATPLGAFLPTPIYAKKPHGRKNTEGEDRHTWVQISFLRLFVVIRPLWVLTDLSEKWGFTKPPIPSLHNFHSSLKLSS